MVRNAPYIQIDLDCMIYVDLNPIRADICDTLENSDYTSVKQRFEQIITKSNTTAPIKLVQFISASQTEEGIPFSLKDYFELTDLTARSVRDNKRCYIKMGTPEILQKLNLDEQTSIETVKNFSTDFLTFARPEEKLKSLCQKQKKKWLRGIQICRILFRHNNSRSNPIPI